MSQPSEWRTVLEDLGARALSVYPDLAFEWPEIARGTALRFPAVGQDGFDVELVATSDGIMLSAGGFHTHFDQPGDIEEQVTQALGLARDLLSTGMRLRERRAGGRPYWWVIEIATATGWKTDQEMGLLFWNYLGRRSEAVFQNQQLPARFP